MTHIGEIFISHTHADEGIAHALSGAIEDVFGGNVLTSYSTKKDGDGGIRPGADWFRWIVERVQSAQLAVILLTPASAQKPWLLWEAGAIYGAALSSTTVDNRKVRPLVFKLSGNQVPSPFAGIQAVDGDDRHQMEQFLDDLIQQFAGKMGAQQVLRAGRRLSDAATKYHERVVEELRSAPLLPTEAAVQEWCSRLDELTRLSRHSEMAQLHDWLNLTFGRDREGTPIPLDLRIHRRLGEAYRAAGRPGPAATEFRLALEFAPRDIFLLRNLGLAHLDDKRPDDALKVIQRIDSLDKNAFSRNAECAALKARYLRERGDLPGAVDTYKTALQNNPDSYYLADVLAQTQLTLGRLEDAKNAYSQADQIIARLGERNVWTLATRATAAILSGDRAKVDEFLRAIASLTPTLDQITRIESGLSRVHHALALPAADLSTWRGALRGTS